jgi:YVTN family beta-propeller protein
MLGHEKIQRLISLIILNIIVLVLVDVFSNLSYSQMLNDRTLEELNKNLPSEYPHINVGKHPRAIAVYSNNYQDIHTVYVVNQGDNTVSMIDGRNNSNTGNYIKVGNAPFAIGVNNFTNKIYVANSLDNTVSVIEAINNTKIRDIKVGNAPFAIGVNNFTNKIYVANYNNDTVSVVDGINDTKVGDDIKVGKGPFAIGVDEFTHKVFVANRNDNTVSVIDATNNTKIRDIKVGYGPRAIGVTDEYLDTIYVAKALDDSVSVINLSSYTTLDDDIKVGDYPTAIGIDSDTETIYVTNYEDKSVSVINGLSDSVVAKVTFKIEPVNAGHIECFANEKLIAPIAQEFYINADTQCIAKPNGGFDFVSWQENLAGNSTQIKQLSAPPSTWDSFLDFLHIKPVKPAAALRITKFGSFTANFKPLPPAIPSEYLVALFGIVAASVAGWLSPTIISSLKSRKEAKIVSTYHHAIESLYNDKKLDEWGIKQLDKLKNDISNDYAKGKISDKQYENTKNEISILYEKIFRKMINSMENLTDKEVAKKQFNEIANYIELVYSEGKLSELHYNLLMKRLQK